jgi:hypothetical protein
MRALGSSHRAADDVFYANGLGRLAVKWSILWAATVLAIERGGPIGLTFSGIQSVRRVFGGLLETPAATGWTYPLDLPLKASIALREIASVVLNPQKSAVRVRGFVGNVLIAAGKHSSFAGILRGIARRNGFGE